MEEIPELAARHRDRDAGVRVLAVSLDNSLIGDDRSPQVVREFLAGRAVPYKQVVSVGSQGALLSAFDLQGNIPYSIQYDARGGIVQRFEGRLSARAVRAALGLAPS